MPTTPDTSPRPDSPIEMVRAGRAGPGCAVEPCTPAEARAYAERLTLGTYENFSVLSRLVPAQVRPDFAAVYAFCRWADDLADEAHRLIEPAEPEDAGVAARERASELLGWWRAELDACFTGRATHPVYVALGDTIARRGLEPEPFHHLIDAFEQDQRVTRYLTWDELLGYCAKSANPVGRIVLRLAGEGNNAEHVRRSDAICTGLQLVNFWQDVRRDLDDRDRVYLPRQETGLDADTLRQFAARPSDPGARVPYIKALRRCTDRTRPMFEELDPLARDLGGWAGPVVRLLGSGGKLLLGRIERAGCATLWRRPTLSKLDKAFLIARCSLAGRRSVGAAS